MKVGKVIYPVLIAGTILTNTSCYTTVRNRREVLKQVLQDHPQKELNDIEKVVNTRKNFEDRAYEYDEELAIYQHKADSVGGSDLIKNVIHEKGSILPKDSADIVKKYGEVVAVQNYGYQKGFSDSAVYNRASEVLSVKQMNPINGYGYTKKCLWEFSSDSARTRNFMKEFGLLDAKTLKKFNKLCKKLKP